MLSKLKNLCYTNLSPDIKPHDQDIEADEYDYNGRLVFRGNVDPKYVEHGLHVYWLYDSDLNCVGLSEHEKDNEDVFEALWFHDNPFSTMLQEVGWTSIDKTVWTLLSNEAYQDCLDDNFTTVIDRSLNSNIRLVTPDMIATMPSIYECQRCKNRSISEMKNCSTVKQPYFPAKIILFVDSDYVLYTPPENSKIWSILNLQQPGASSPVQQPAPEQEPEREAQPEQEPLQQPDSQTEERHPHPLEPPLT